MEADYQRKKGGGGFAFSGGRPVAAAGLGSQVRGSARSTPNANWCVGGGLTRTWSLDHGGGATRCGGGGLTRTWSSNHGGGGFALTSLGTLGTGKAACGSFAASRDHPWLVWFPQGGGGKAIGGGPRGGSRSSRGRQQSKMAPICKTSCPYQSNDISSRVLVRQQTVPTSQAVARG